jgi:hypothetical protein
MKKTYASTGLILSLVLLFSACEKEGTEADLGGKVALTVSLNSRDYVEAGARGFQMKTDETALEEVVVPLGEDENYYLMATLRPDPEQADELRGAPSNGQRIALAAFDNATDALAAGPVNYYYSNTLNDLIPMVAGSPLVVDVNKTYYIAAYSYNSTTVNPGTSGIDPSMDLLWGKSNPKYITLSDRTVEINMDHLFSRVKVNISVANIPSASISAIGTVRIEGRRQAGLTLNNGDLTPGSAAGALDVTSTLTGSGVTRESGYYVFYPSPTKVTISSITITGVANPLTNLEAIFTKTLEAGKNYILAVDLAKVGWATSNIYWDGSQLTFDKYQVGSHPTYQGVFFKHGSLVGISPAIFGSYVNDILSIILYAPPVRGESAWVATTIGAANAWGSTYASIPYVGGVSTSTTSDNYLYDQLNDPDTHYYNYNGDICSYLTGGTWRMPNVDEFGAAANYTVGLGDTNQDPQNATGKGLINVGLTYNTGSESVFFPYSGQRNASGVLNPTGSTVGGNLAYWSGSAVRYSSTQVVGLVKSNNVRPQEPIASNWSSSVRCIKN